MRARAKQNLAVAREKLADADAALRAGARRAMNATDDYVHENPWSSIGAAAAVGMLIWRAAGPSLSSGTRTQGFGAGAA